MDKHKLFKIASTATDTPLTQFAKRHNVTPTAIHRVLTGETKSEHLSTEVDNFIRSGLRQLRIDLRSMEQN